MKPHKHAELIKAWADGAEIEAFDSCIDEWVKASSPSWFHQIEYRIKPEPKPDVRLFAYVGRYEGDLTEVEIVHKLPNLILWFDGETGELKSAEVVK
jgi:hypothetical protein